MFSFLVCFASQIQKIASGAGKIVKTTLGPFVFFVHSKRRNLATENDEKWLCDFETDLPSVSVFCLEPDCVCIFHFQPGRRLASFWGCLLKKFLLWGPDCCDVLLVQIRSCATRCCANGVAENRWCFLTQCFVQIPP